MTVIFAKSWIVVFTAGLAWVLVGTIVFRTYRRKAAAARSVLPGPFPAPGDSMAWLLARGEFERRLEAELVWSDDAVDHVSVTLFRVDNIDEITTLLGETAGELVLERVAWTVRNAINGEDVIAQLDRGVCGVIMVRPSPEYAGIHAERLRESVSAGAYLILGQIDPVHFTVSVGVARFPEHGKSPAELIRAAETALKPGAAHPKS